jgi:hypothetical protein
VTQARPSSVALFDRIFITNLIILVILAHFPHFGTAERSIIDSAEHGSRKVVLELLRSSSAVANFPNWVACSNSEKRLDSIAPI